MRDRSGGITYHGVNAACGYDARGVSADEFMRAMHLFPTPILVMLIPEGDEEHDREGAQISGRIARSNEWVDYDLYRFPFSQSRGHGRWRGFLLEKGGGASFWKRVVRNSIPAAGRGGAVGSHA